jgi:hypothetical protein
VMIDRPSPEATPKRVYHHAPVLFVQHEPNCTRIYYEDLPNAEKKSLSWSKFKRLAKLAGLQRNISKNTTRQLTDKLSANLNDYWEEAR